MAALAHPSRSPLLLPSEAAEGGGWQRGRGRAPCCPGLPWRWLARVALAGAWEGARAPWAAGAPQWPAAA